MAQLSADQQSDAAGHVRGLENDADRALSVVRYLENCESSDELRDAAATLRDAANSLYDMARALDSLAAGAESNETCPECGAGVENADEFSGYCSTRCEDINN